MLFGMVSLALVAFSVAGEDLILPRVREPYVVDFNGFRGKQDSVPVGFLVSADSKASIGTNDYLGVHCGGTTEGGCYAWQIASNNYALGYQPTADEFTPGYFMLVISNGTDTVVRRAELSYEIIYLNNAGRSSSLDLDFSIDGVKFYRLPQLRFCTPEAASPAPAWTTVSRAISVLLPREILPAGRLWIRWSGDDAGGAGSRDEYGIDNVRITLYPPSGTVITVQ